MRHLFNFSLRDALKMILEYNKTKDNELFLSLLAKFDMYLIYVAHKLKFKYSVLQYEEMQDLYHIAIIATSKAFKTVRASDDPETIPARIQAYIKAEVRRIYRYKYKEELLPQTEGKTSRWDLDQHVSNIDLEDILKLSGLTEEEKGVVQLRFLGGYSYNEIQNSLGLTKMKIRWRLKLALSKLSKFIRKELK